MAVNGKQKGNSFERTIANLLSARFEQKTGLASSFRRNPDSGSFFGASNQKRTETHSLEFAVFGDLICPKKFKFSVECKSYKTPPSFGAVVKGEVSQWDDWLKQAAQDAKNSCKLMMLIIKYNNVNQTVFLDFKLQTTQELMKYKGFYLYKLSDLLLLTDDFFFDE